MLPSFIIVPGGGILPGAIVGPKPPLPLGGGRLPGGPVPGSWKSGFASSMRACVLDCRLGGPNWLNSPPYPGRQFGFTPLCETEVKLLVSDSAGDLAPGRSS
jgi:hypothetical protein